MLRPARIMLAVGALATVLALVLVAALITQAPAVTDGRNLLVLAGAAGACVVGLLWMVAIYLRLPSAD